jgi:hypothetical protein
MTELDTGAPQRGPNFIAPDPGPARVATQAIPPPSVPPRAAPAVTPPAPPAARPSAGSGRRVVLTAVVATTLVGAAAGMGAATLTGTGSPASGNIGIGFAIPVDRAADVAERLIAGS